MKRKEKSKNAMPPLSRRLLDKMLLDLADRLKVLRYEAEAIEKFVAPNVQHTVSEYQARQACGILIGSLQRRIHDAEGLLGLLVNRSGMSRP